MRSVPTGRVLPLRRPYSLPVTPGEMLMQARGARGIGCAHDFIYARSNTCRLRRRLAVPGGPPPLDGHDGLPQPVDISQCRPASIAGRENCARAAR